MTEATWEQDAEAPKDEHLERSRRLQEARERAKTDHEEGASDLKKWAHTTKGVAQYANPLGAISLLGQVDFLADMPYAAALGAAVLKDILDIADFETVVLPFLFSLLCTIFIFMMLQLVGGNKKKSSARTFVKSTVALIGGGLADAIPGVDLLPIETAVVIVLYIWELRARKEAAGGQ
ncbi:MAG TPA: hypothetical protein VF817_03485 [Patescibacteria group bacterium]